MEKRSWLPFGSGRASAITMLIPVYHAIRFSGDRLAHFLPRKPRVMIPSMRWRSCRV